MDNSSNILNLSELYSILEQRKVMNVTIRNGKRQKLHLESIKERIEKLSYGLDKNYVNIDLIVQKVVQGMYDGISTSVLDNLASETCAYMNIIHPHYSQLAARIAISNLHKETKESFSETISDLHLYEDQNGQNASLIAYEIYKIVVDNAEVINSKLNYNNDYTYDYFGFKTLEKSYLLKIKDKIVERPQHMLMRVAIGIHKQNLDKAYETYQLMSEKWFTHATPTLFNAGTPRPQMSSCFLVAMKEDSIDGIYDTLKQCALISKSAGGIGISIHDIRAKDSYIKGTNGHANGLVPMLKVFNDTSRYVDQGGGKRKGSFAIYLEPWHADIFDFLSMKKNHGKEENKARDLFYALWIPDLFMKRVEQDGDWTLMCPNECKGLSDVWGQEFETLYTGYEKSQRGRKSIKARVLWQEIIDSQIETGTPYMLFKDQCNRKSNQSHLGTIKSSNLCTEIIQYSSPDEVAVCNLASINLQKFVTEKKEFDFELLSKIVKIITNNMNNIIDYNYYPIKEAENSNMRHRPIGIGVQGLADTFFRMKICFESPEALQLNEKIFETIYFAACQSSMELSTIQGPYKSFEGSPSSKGILQFDMWDYKPRNQYDWDKLKQDIMQYGLRNSLFIAPMPTASTSQILGNCESFEPYTSNLYTRRVLAGEFVVINPHLVDELIKLNLWNVDIKNKLIQANGSVLNIKEIPDNIRQLFKTVWEISQKAIINLALSRAPFIDQSQSLNIYLAQPNYSKLSSIHFYTWKNGLKTGMYYLRSKPAAEPIKFTVDVESLLKDAGNIQVKKQNSEQNQKQQNQLLNEFDNKENQPSQQQNNFKCTPELDIDGKEIEGSCFSCGS